MKRIQILFVALLALTMSCGTLQKITTNYSFPLETTSWQVTSLNGKRMQLTDEERYTLNFNLDDALNARGECNIIFGSYIQSRNEQLEITPKGSTRTACPDMDVEAEFMETLTQVASFVVGDDEQELQLLNEQGEVVMKLQRRLVREI